MLQPRDRRLLLDALRPPPGYALDRAIGTSYTLDLLALLSAPLAFTFFDWQDGEGRLTDDPLALLRAIRRHADRIHLFCQSGRIAIPPSGRLLLQYLEESVVEVAAPQEGGVFHPKIWVLRYASEDAPVRYRFICLSRNLTFDRSWDTALVLDGQLADRTRAFGVNRPLSEFIGQLPGLAVRATPEAASDAAELLASEIGRVRFELPHGFDEFAFWPMGTARRAVWPFPDPQPGRRMLVVSPFLSDSLLARLNRDRPKGILVSRPESVAALQSDTLQAFSEILAIDPDAEAEDEEGDSSSPEQVIGDPLAPPAGLHAKLYVMDDGWKARVWTGSANATGAAFARNVEFLVELRGKKGTCGIDALLGTDGADGLPFGGLLRPVVVTDETLAEEDTAAAEVLDRLRLELGRADLRVIAQASEAEGTFELFLERGGGPVTLPDDVSLRCWPVTLRADSAVTFDGSRQHVASFGMVSADALTSFVGFHARLAGDGNGEARFVLNLPLSGAPEDRRERLLQAIIGDSERFLRLIWLLLSDPDLGASQFAESLTGETPTLEGMHAASAGLPIMEGLLRALSRNPGRVDEIGELVRDLRRTQDGSRLLPEEFDAVWEAVWQVRERTR